MGGNLSTIEKRRRLYWVGFWVRHVGLVVVVGTAAIDTLLLGRAVVLSPLAVAMFIVVSPVFLIGLLLLVVGQYLASRNKLYRK